VVLLWSAASAALRTRSASQPRTGDQRTVWPPWVWTEGGPWSAARTWGSQRWLLHGRQWRDERGRWRRQAVRAARRAGPACAPVRAPQHRRLRAHDNPQRAERITAPPVHRALRLMGMDVIARLGRAAAASRGHSSRPCRAGRPHGARLHRCLSSKSTGLRAQGSAHSTPCRQWDVRAAPRCPPANTRLLADTATQRMFSLDPLCAQRRPSHAVV
jgi:hypothetical protein